MFKAKTFKKITLVLFVFFAALLPLSRQVALAQSTPSGDINRVEDPAEKTARQCSDPRGCVSDIYTKFINPIINLLSVVVGLVVITTIIVGGIQFSSSSGDPNKIQAARKKISNALIALVAYLFLFAFLQWIVPGGIFG
jgi:hypothetical protein